MLCSAAGCEFDVCVCIIAPPLKTRDLPPPSSPSSPLVTCALQISGMINSVRIRCTHAYEGVLLWGVAYVRGDLEQQQQQPDCQRSNDRSNLRLITRGRATQSNQDALLVRDFFSNL